MADLYEYIGFTRTGMIGKWLEAQGWHVVPRAEGDLYMKKPPVMMDTESALFQELMDRCSAHDFAIKAYIEAQQELFRYRFSAKQLYDEVRELRKLHSEVT